MAATELGGAIYTRSQAVSGLTALVSTRVYPLEIPQGATYPAIRYMIVSRVPHHLSGSDSSLLISRVQFDLYATSVAGVRTLQAQVRAAFSRYRGTVGGVTIQDSYLQAERDWFDTREADAAWTICRVTQDYEVWHIGG